MAACIVGLKGFICERSGFGSSLVTTLTVASAAGAGVKVESLAAILATL